MKKFFLVLTILLFLPARTWTRGEPTIGLRVGVREPFCDEQRAAILNRAFYDPAFIAAIMDSLQRRGLLGRPDASLQAELESLKRALEQLKRELRQARSQAPAQQKRIIIVDHSPFQGQIVFREGPNGMIIVEREKWRRPR